MTPLTYFLVVSLALSHAIGLGIGFLTGVVFTEYMRGRPIG